MRKVLLLLLLLGSFASVTAQQLSYADRLYYTAKAWGLIKYAHPLVTTGTMDWDAVLHETLTEMQGTVDVEMLNDALLSMLKKAGPVPVASTPPPSVEEELNLGWRFDWLGDVVLREDVRAGLDSIVSNFRPHPSRWVRLNSGAGPFLQFPEDDPVLPVDASQEFPDEAARLRMFIAYWNILQYFNPNIHILGVPWDSTLRTVLPLVAEATDYTAFFQAIKRATAALDDAHVDGWTMSMPLQVDRYGLQLVIGWTTDGYTVLHSGIPDIPVGNIILSVDGRSITQIEDSARKYVSAGNEAIYHSIVASSLFRGALQSPITVTHRDSAGAVHVFDRVRNVPAFTAWHAAYYPSDTLAEVHWRRWGCNVGYVHMGNLTLDEVDAMYAELQDCSAIIFDIRNYPQGTAAAIAQRIYPDRMTAVRFTVPDVRHPGAFVRAAQEFGSPDNPEPYLGKVIILCDASTVSHAEWSCMLLRAMPNSVVVGSQTAGADGNVTYFHLTNDIRTGFTTLGVYWPDGRQTQRIGIVPDSVVSLTATDARAGRDPLLEKALAVAGCSVAGIAGSNSVPAGIDLDQNYPNPFNPSTRIRYTLPRAGHVRLLVCDLLGRQLCQLVDAWQAAGTHDIAFRAGTMAAGSYRYVLEMDGAIRSRMMTLIK